MDPGPRGEDVVNDQIDLVEDTKCRREQDVFSEVFPVGTIVLLSI